ncbi:MAG: cutinase family protein [Mycobacteriaceae bacterium]|nr:cutinase family protein [Mycobacteriaceae bacterium]
MVRRNRNVLERCWAARFFTVLVLSGMTLVTCSGQAHAANCTTLEVVSARGTGEPGALGAVVGDPVFAALRRVLPETVSAYGVKYPATLDMPVSSDHGVVDLVGHLTRQAASCPAQRFILVGYSQGAFVIDQVLGAAIPFGRPAALPGWVSPRIAAVLLFGNPIRITGWRIDGVFSGRTADFCTPGDPICQLGGLNPAAHTNYARDIAAAARFAAARI